MKIADLYQSVTDSIIRELESGAVPWTKPWKAGKAVGVMPMNAGTGRAYSGINIPILWAAAERHCYPTHGWMTYRQAITAGAQVRGGEKATTVVFTKQLRLKDAETEAERKVGMLRTFAVFNVAQIDGLKPTADIADAVPVNINQNVEAFIGATKAIIRPGGDKACFVPSHDFIALPLVTAFKEPESYYATALHELGHWTGHKSRLDRDLANRFGTRAYAAEELIAELAAAFLCAHLNITGELRHAGYIENWLQLLKEDNRAIFTAASKASQAANYLRAFSEEAVPE